MQWIERFGNYLALSLLAFMWPVIDAPQKGLVPSDYVALFALSAGAYVVVYSWYCLWGHTRRNAAVPVGTVLVLTLLALALQHLVGMPNFNYLLIPLAVAGFALAPRLALLTIACVATASILDAVLLDGANLPAGRLALRLALVVPVVLLFGGGAMALRYLLNTVAELRAARAELAQQAADRERARIARDLHDLLGHSLSLITLKGELATRLLPEGTAGSNEVRDMVALSREALRQVREAVSGYRQPTLATELRAAQLALKAAGLEVDVSLGIGALDRESEAVLGWVIREATTNVIRHAGAKHCRISLGETDGQLQVEVLNDGWRVVQPPAGNGLRGLEERLASIGGTLEASPLPEAGFRLRARIRESMPSGSVHTAAEVVA
jgi:two-component system, NarL family, sensor histidine kinase DesK